jgi:hypothetical protein
MILWAMDLITAALPVEPAAPFTPRP